MIFGRKIRELRDEQGILQRQLAALLEIDTPMFSKIERGDRKAKREQVIKMAEYFHQDVNDMLTIWLADKVLDTVKNEDTIDLAAINIAKEEIKTKKIAEMLKNLKVESKALIVTNEKNDNVVKSAKNIEGVATTFTGILNVYDVLKYDVMVITKDAVSKIEEVYA